MTKPNHKGSFRARVAFAIQALERRETRSRAFDACFEYYDGEAVVTAIMRYAPGAAAGALGFDQLQAWRQTAAAHGGADVDSLSRALIRKNRADFDRALRDHIAAQQATDAEPVELQDGPALQHLVPGVEPVSLAARQLEAEQRRRAGRRGSAPLPSGGLFDDVARQQQELF